MKVHRLIAILLLLESRGTLNANELAGALEVSKRTIHRDIEELCQAGVPIASHAGQAGGYYLINGYTSSLKSLCTDEVITLYLSGIGIHPQKHTESSASLQNALLKLEKILAPSYAKDIQRVQQRFLFDPEVWWNHQDITCLEALRRAVLKGSKLEITYQSASLGKNSTAVRIVSPYGLVVKHSEWYLVGYCDFKKAVRTFKCDRITTVNELDEVFAVPEDFSLTDYWNQSLTHFKDKASYKPEYKVQLRKTDQIAAWPENLDILEDWGDTCVANLYSFDNALQTVWSLKNGLVVVEPEALRLQIKGLADELVKQYAK